MPVWELPLCFCGKIGNFALMKCFISFLSALSALLLLASCDAFEYHPYVSKIEGKTGTNDANAAILEASGLKPPFKFAFITDTQGSLDETRSAIDVIKRRSDIDFIVHGGDMADFGLVKEFVWTRDILEDSRIPYVAVIGNHDCLANGEETFSYIFGSQNYSFNVGPVHFLCLNTVALEYDYSRPVPDLDFIEKDALAVPDSITHSVVVMHSRPYDEQFNNNVAKPFDYYVRTLPGMRDDDARRSDGTFARGLCINGHNHKLAVSDIFDNGVLYYQCPNMAKRTFFVFTITEDGYDYEEVTF